MQYTSIMNAIVKIKLPKALRKELGVETGRGVPASVSATGIGLHSAATFPIELYHEKRIAAFDAADAELARHLAEKGL